MECLKQKFRTLYQTAELYRHTSQYSSRYLTMNLQENIPKNWEPFPFLRHFQTFGRYCPYNKNEIQKYIKHEIGKFVYQFWPKFLGQIMRRKMSVHIYIFILSIIEAIDVTVDYFASQYAQPGYVFGAPLVQYSFSRIPEMCAPSHMCSTPFYHRTVEACNANFFFSTLFLFGDSPITVSFSNLTEL